MDLFLSTALLPEGWADSVRLSIDPDGSILAVRRGASPSEAERVDGYTVPGVPNLHSHAFQRAMAGLTEHAGPGADDFWSWRARMYAFLELLGPDEVQAIAAQLFVELLRHGYTHVAEFHYLRNAPDGTAYDDPTETGGRIVAAAAAAGIGLTLLPTLYAASDFGGVAPVAAQRRFLAGPEEVLGDIGRLFALTAGRGDVHIGLALHSLRAVPPGELSAAVDGLADLVPDAPVHIHVAEQEREVQACLAWSGARPVAWLLDHAPVDERWCLVHATHMDEGETHALAGTGAVVGLCPTTEANLGDGLFPLATYTQAGGRWGVGTDSHVSTSPAADLRLLEYGQRLTLRRRNVAAASDGGSTGRGLLERAWSGGARACGRPIGRLEPGARADLVVLDPDHPALVGRSGDAALDAWIFSGEETPVRHVMVGGRWVVLDRHHPRQAEVAQAYRRVARSLVGPGA